MTSIKKDHLFNFREILVILVLISIFIIDLVLVLTQNSYFLDEQIYNFVRLFKCDFLDWYFVFITKFGNPIFVLILVFAFILIFRNKYGILLGTCACCSTLSNKFIKYIIRRSRPTVLKLIKQGGYSFPSGHAMIAVSLYGYLLYLVISKIKNKYLKYFLVCFLIIIIFSIGISRIYVGVHYATDIIGGYVLASIEVILLVKVSNKYYRGS